MDQEKQKRNELKKEFVRGLDEGRKIHDCHNKFLDMIKDKLTDVINKSYTVEDAQDRVESVIQLIDEYCDGEVSVDELAERDSVDKLKQLAEMASELENDNIISLTDLIEEEEDD